MSKDMKNVCSYCEKEKPCPFIVFFGHAEYPMCDDCTDEAGKDGFAWAVKK